MSRSKFLKTAIPLGVIVVMGVFALVQFNNLSRSPSLLGSVGSGGSKTPGPTECMLPFDWTTIAAGSDEINILYPIGPPYDPRRNDMHKFTIEMATMAAKNALAECQKELKEGKEMCMTGASDYKSQCATENNKGRKSKPPYACKYEPGEPKTQECTGSSSSNPGTCKITYGAGEKCNAKFYMTKTAGMKIDLPDDCVPSNFRDEVYIRCISKGLHTDSATCKKQPLTEPSGF